MIPKGLSITLSGALNMCSFCPNQAHHGFSGRVAHCKSCYEAHERAGECPNE